MSYDEYEKSKLWAVVRKVEALYNAQTLPGDDLTIRTGLVSVGNTSFVVRQQASNRRKEVVCDANIVYVTVSPDGKPIPVPDQWRNLFSPWVGGCQVTAPSAEKLSAAEQTKAAKIGAAFFRHRSWLPIFFLSLFFSRQDAFRQPTGSPEDFSS